MLRSTFLNHVRPHLWATHHHLSVSPASRSLSKLVRRPTSVVKDSNDYEYFQSKSHRPFWQTQRFWFWFGGVGGVSVYFYLSNLKTVPISGRNQFLAISPMMEERMSRAAYQEIMTQYHGQILPRHHPYTLFVQKVAQKIIQVSGLGGLNWEVHVIQSPQPNAFVLPGGKIFVFTGILPIVKNEDGMAAVLGHEIAHQLARHSAERVSWGVLLLPLQLAVAYIFDGSLLFSRAIFEFGILSPFSRKCESEADYIGLILMSQACYDPHAAVEMWERMKKSDITAKIPQYLSTHPSHESRIEKLSQWLPEAERVREQSDCSHVSSIYNAFRNTRWASW